MKAIYIFIFPLFLVICSCQTSDYKSMADARITCWKDFPINGIDGKIVDDECLKGYYLDSIKGQTIDGKEFHVGHSGYKLYLINT